MKLLWLDDTRNPFLADWLLRYAPEWDEDRDNVTWVKTYEEFIAWIQKWGLPEMICFDHDLGGKYDGYDAAKWLVNYCLKHQLQLPKWNVQSANPVGRENIEGIFKSFVKHHSS